MNNFYVEAFNNLDCNESALIGRKCYSPPDLVFHFLPVREKVNNIEVNRMRIG